MLPTCAVSCTVHDQSGNPEVGAIVTAKLSSYEVYSGYVVPETVTGTTNAQGVAVLNLWSNQLGATESVYDITIKPQSGRSLRTTAIVPNQETAQLHLIAELPPYPGKTDGQLILDEAVAAGAVAVAKAEIATAQAEIATTKAEEASDAAEKTDQAIPVLNNFVNRRYLGAHSVPPTLNNDGSALEDGALYFNTASNAMFARGSGVWSMTTAASSADLANGTDPAKGSALVGHMPSGTGAVAMTVQSKLRETVSVTDFYANGISGAKVDPTGGVESAAGILKAMTYAASTGAKLISPKKAIYLIGSGLPIPSGLIADFNYSTIKRKTGSVFDMLSNTGGNEINISNLIVDGQRQADGRVATNVADRFGGIVFNSVTFSKLHNVQVNNTVNAEDGRAGVYLGGCKNVDLYNVGGAGNDRSCVLIDGGSYNRIFSSYTKDNLGSGVTSGNANDCEYYNCLAINSGYSGISINGKRNKARNLRATGTAAGYAGVNIGHDDANNRADDSIVENIHSYDNLGWGLSVIGSSRVQLQGVYLKGNTNNNLWISGNASACSISQITSTLSGSSGVLIQSGTGHKIISGEIFSNAFHGIDVESGCSAIITEDVRVYNNGTADNTCAGVLLNGSTGSIVEAECFDNQETKTQGYGVWLNSGTSNVVSAYLHDNKTAPLRETASPSYINRNTRTGSNNLSGTFTATAGQNMYTIANNNARAGMVVMFYAVNSAGTALGIPRLGVIAAGVSFVANLGGTAAGTEGYGYVIV